MDPLKNFVFRENEYSRIPDYILKKYLPFKVFRSPEKDFRYNVDLGHLNEGKIEITMPDKYGLDMIVEITSNHLTHSKVTVTPVIESKMVHPKNEFVVLIWGIRVQTESGMKAYVNSDAAAHAENKSKVRICLQKNNVLSRTIAREEYNTIVESSISIKGAGSASVDNMKVESLSDYSFLSKTRPL